VAAGSGVDRETLRKAAELDLEQKISKRAAVLFRSGDGLVGQGVLCEFIAAQNTSYGERSCSR
jgi:hypothetical protein